jgi:hypothetical protein
MAQPFAAAIAMKPDLAASALCARIDRPGKRLPGAKAGTWAQVQHEAVPEWGRVAIGVRNE